jgi:anti-anti-sigma factor
MTTMNGANDIVTIMLPERVNSVTALAVEKSMLDALQPGARLIVEGSAVIYMSAAGVRAFATALREAAARQARVVFCRFSGAADDCLIVGGFSKLLDVADSVEDARVRLSSGSAGNPAERLHKQGVTGTL